MTRRSPRYKTTRLGIGRHRITLVDGRRFRFEFGILELEWRAYDENGDDYEECLGTFPSYEKAKAAVFEDFAKQS